MVGGVGARRARLGVLVAVLTGVVGRTTRAVPATAPPVVLEAVATPVPGPTASASVLAGATDGTGSPAGSRASSLHPARSRTRGRRSDRATIIAKLSTATQHVGAARFVDETETEISPRWMEGFYPIYATAQRTFGVNWLLIASIHKQESAFSTAPTTYHGLNFAAAAAGRCNST